MLRLQSAALRPRVPERSGARDGRHAVRAVVFISLTVITLVTGACGGSGGDGAVAKVPSRSGDLWEAAAPADRGQASGAMLAFANGLHTMVIDGDEVYAGMTRLAAVSGPNGTRMLTLPNGLTAQLEPRGGQLVLRFSTGDTVVMRRAGVAEGQS